MITEIERRLFKLAQDELQDYPGAFSAFQQDNQNRSWYATTLSASLPSEIQLRILSLYGPLEVCRIIDPPLRKFIDEWRECYATAPCAAPLPALPSSVRPIANLEAVPVEQAANPTAAKGEAVEEFSGGFDFDGAPSLTKGRNSREQIEAWVVWQAQHKVKNGDTTSALADRIKLEADKWGYEAERENRDGDNKLTTPNIIKMIPAGLTGGRAKNTGKPKN